MVVSHGATRRGRVPICQDMSSPSAPQMGMLVQRSLSVVRVAPRTTIKARGGRAGGAGRRRGGGRAGGPPPTLYALPATRAAASGRSTARRPSSAASRGPQRLLDDMAAEHAQVSPGERVRPSPPPTPGATPTESMRPRPSPGGCRTSSSTHARRPPQRRRCLALLKDKAHNAHAGRAQATAAVAARRVCSRRHRARGCPRCHRPWSLIRACSCDTCTDHEAWHDRPDARACRPGPRMRSSTAPQACYTA